MGESYSLQQLLVRIMQINIRYILGHTNIAKANWLVMELKFNLVTFYWSSQPFLGTTLRISLGKVHRFGNDLLYFVDNRYFYCILIIFYSYALINRD